MTQLPSNEFRNLMVEMLADIHRFCVENGISYHLVSGTLLGAIRHQGFIPWDDDLDIAMPRPDFERFKKEYTHPYFKFISADTDQTYPLDYAKVHDIRTVIKEENGTDVNWGVFIDVFPVDGVPSKELASKKVRQIQRIRRFAANQRFTRKYHLRAHHGIKKNVRVILGKMAHPFISLQQILRFEDRKMQSYAFSECPYAYYLPFVPVVIVPKEYIEETVLVSFEGILVNAPKEYDKWLTQLYGDYMTPPPPEQQKSRHGISAYWK